MVDEGRSTALDEDERAELERLRAQAATPRSRARGLRWTACGVLLVIFGMLVLGSVAARFVRSQVLDTDRYVATVTPLASDPAVQAELADKITSTVLDHVDVRAMTADAVGALTENAPGLANRPLASAALSSLPAMAASGAQSLIHQTVTTLVTSSEFEQMWVEANRAAHKNLVAVVTGDQGAALQVDKKGTVSVNLKAILSTVKERLDQRGLTFVDRLPEVNAQFVIFQSADVIKAQHGVRLLDRLADWLPWIALAVAAGAVWVAPGGRRLRALALVGVSGTLAMLLLAIGLALGRAVYLHDVPPTVLSPDAARAIIDAVLAPLRTLLRAVLAVALVIAIVGYLAGPSRSARAVRSGFGRAVDRVRRPGPDHTPNAVESFVGAYLTPLRLVVVGAAVLTIAFWRYPTGMVVVWTVIVAVLLLLALELVGRPARTVPARDTPAT
ncbi:hypothetical protein G4X40_16615 [Rhodococcus sp. D2-41]|uniref:Integral membrane protein n=1 Tax=Speluncibacter jeojiensis TaxID=2710754 RepID=A0A9X4M0D5_9ACTN|nr:hypothetical protein [Rhodococcus sp. D2-41]MDG3011770.1 hypothetical protein [Rhodococcus sp. D2-41]MDG3014876.1 hypothetical protein [Corynebacteriales bacterium D3-21]